MGDTIQIGALGAVQRAHPALAQLWLEWTGIRNLERAVFDMARAEEGALPATAIKLPAIKGLTESWQHLCDVMGVPEDGPQRRRSPIYVEQSSSYHKAFWDYMKRRELQEVDGPLEFWWRLLVIRYNGVKRASKALIRRAVDDDPALDKALISFNNPTLKNTGQQASNLLVGGEYAQPTEVYLCFPERKSERFDTLAISLEEPNFKGQFVSTLIDLATQKA